ncbi:MAG: CinA family protein [Rhodobacteraceae bacterium]|nr:CinA family protein [Paracoccaceae bacterium]
MVVTWSVWVLTRAETLLARARASGAIIATAESCTGGLVAGAITDVAGSSDVFDRGFVTYSNAAKQDILGVQTEVLNLHGAVSEEVAMQMAEGAWESSAANIAISVTGIAGPGGNECKPEGRVCFGLAQEGHPTRTETIEFGALGRTQVRQATVDYALDLLLAALS